MNTGDARQGGAVSKSSFLERLRRLWRGSAADVPMVEPGEEAGASLSPEIIARIRSIHLRTHHLVDDLMAGEYVSAFKGRGMEFEEVREYQVGDDVRTIDWNVTARMNHPYVKTYREEREMTVMLLVDVSSSGQFGSQARTKNQVAAEVAAILAYAAIRNNDKVGLILFTDVVEKYIPPKKGRGHVWRVIREVLKPRATHGRTDLAAALEYLTRITHRRVVCFVISDFLDEGYERPLLLASKAHELVCITITDPRERVLPDIGLVELQDAETGEVVLLDTSAAAKSFGTQVSAWYEAREKMFRSMKIDHIALRTEDPDTISPLLKYFRLRERRL